MFVCVCFSLRCVEQCPEAEYSKKDRQVLVLPLCSRRSHPRVLSIQNGKGRKCMSVFVLCAFDLVQECTVFPWESPVSHAWSFPIFTSIGMRPNAQKQFPICLTRIWGKITQQDHVISNSQYSFLQTQTNTSGYFSTVFPTVSLTKLLLLSVLGRKGHAGKSLWRSITQFSVGSAADTQVIYSEGARTS